MLDRRRSTFGKSIIVTGGAGFLGSHLCETLIDRGDRVVCLDNFLTGSRANVVHLMAHPRFTLIEHDICKPIPNGGKVDQIYNLACAASPPRYQDDPVHTMRTCVLGTLNLLDLAERSNARFLQASTSEIYGDPEQHPQAEEYWGHVNCTGPRACYDEGKRAAETLCFDFLRTARVDVRIARIFNTYGPRMQPDDGRIVSTLIIQALNNQPLTIYGDGSQTRSFCYVSDMVRGLVELMDIPINPASPVNLGNPGEFTINELARLVVKATGSDSRPIYLPLPMDDPQRRRPNIERAGELLGWRPLITLDEGVEMTIDHFMNLAARLKRSPALVGSSRTALPKVATLNPER